MSKVADGLSILLERPYWIGFALPFGPLLGALRTLAVVAALRRTAPETEGVPA